MIWQIVAYKDIFLLFLFAFLFFLSFCYFTRKNKMSGYKEDKSRQLLSPLL